jgi:sulfide:quinone oxidoreductase
MAKRVVVLGGGAGGTLTANRLRRLYSRSEVEIAVIDQDDRHVYQPRLFFVPFGLAHIEEIRKWSKYPQLPARSGSRV